MKTAAPRGYRAAGVVLDEVATMPAAAIDPPATVAAPPATGGDVVIGWVTPGTVHNGFTDSLLRTFAHDVTTGARRLSGWNSVTCSANISAGRNSLVEWFVDDTGADWLLMVDTDMVWPADALARLLDAADPEAYPVVGALCFGRDPGTGEIWPTMYDLAGTEEKPAFVRYQRWAPEQMFPVIATGAAFLLIHRTVAEEIRALQFSAAFPWFQEREFAGARVGEDITFCMRAHQAGRPVWVHTGVHTGHVKSAAVTLAGYLAQQSAADQEETPEHE